MESLANFTGEQLLIEAGNGHQAYFGEFYRRYRIKVIHFIRQFVRSAEEAEDLAQDVFIQLWKDRQKIGVVGNADAYLFVICRNVSMKALRKKSVVDTINPDGQYDMPAYALMQHNPEYQEARQLAEEAIQTLPPQAQLVFRMSRDQGLSCKAISKQLGISKHTVYNQIKKSLQHIRDYFATHSPDTLLAVLWCFGLLGVL